MPRWAQWKRRSTLQGSTLAASKAYDKRTLHTTIKSRTWQQKAASVDQYSIVMCIIGSRLINSGSTLINLDQATPFFSVFRPSSLTDYIKMVFFNEFNHWKSGKNLVKYVLLNSILYFSLGKWAKLQSVGQNTEKIKSMIDRGGATCWNNNHFEHPIVLNAPWDDGRTDGWTDGRYQTYYLPCFAVDKNTFSPP